MKLKPRILGIIASALCATAQADVIGASAGVVAWNPDFKGDVRSGGESVSVEDDLRLKDDWFTQAYVALEHPIPLLPNIKLQFTELTQDGQGQVNATFNGVNFGGPVKSELDLSHADLVLYYEVLDNIVSLDLGLGARFFDGQLKITQTNVANRSSQTDLDEVIPLVYVAPSVSLPLTGLSVGAEVAGIGYSGNRLMDVTARIRYEIVVVGIEAGWRQLEVKLDDIDDIDADIKFGGPFVSLMVDF